MIVGFIILIVAASAAFATGLHIRDRRREDAERAARRAELEAGEKLVQELEAESDQINATLRRISIKHHERRMAEKAKAKASNPGYTIYDHINEA